MKKRLLKYINWLLSGVVTLLGFQSCDVLELREEYGSPYAKYNIDGLITDMQGRGIEGETVIIRPTSKEGDPIYGYEYADSIKTDVTGRFKYSKDDYHYATQFRIVATGKDGKYEPDSVQINLDKTKKGTGWFSGEYSSHVDLSLKEK